MDDVFPGSSFDSPLFAPVLLIDADEARGQRLAAALTLADFHVYVASTPFQALERSLHEPMSPLLILLGQGDWRDAATDLMMRRLTQRLSEPLRRTIPVLTLPSPSHPYTSGTPYAGSYTSSPFTMRPSSPALSPFSAVSPLPPLPPLSPTHEAWPPQVDEQQTLFLEALPGNLPARQTEGMQLLEMIWNFVPALRKDMRPAPHSLALDLLPAQGLTPHVSLAHRSANSHFRQVLEAARKVIPLARWDELLTDVGLAYYRDQEHWPPDNSERAVPSISFSLLNAAVELSAPDDPVGQLRQWSSVGTQASLARRPATWIQRQVIKHMPQERLLSMALNSFTNEMNELRGEVLHFWRPRTDGSDTAWDGSQAGGKSYWLVHYSNLYAEGRSRRPNPSCHVWLASIESTLQLVGLDKVYSVREVECSCQTLTGHCVFLIEPRLNWQELSSH